MKLVIQRHGRHYIFTLFYNFAQKKKKKKKKKQEQAGTGALQMVKGA